MSRVLFSPDTSGALSDDEAQDPDFLGELVELAYADDPNVSFVDDPDADEIGHPEAP